MRKYGSNKRNPNPPWPNQQSVVVVPDKTTASSMGIEDEMVRTVSADKITLTDKEYKEKPFEEKLENSINDSFELSQDKDLEDPVSDAFEDRKSPIMNYIPETAMRSSDLAQKESSGQELSTRPANSCGMMAFSKYLCGQTGRLVRAEFLFGENTHIEKTGVLKSVGKDFFVISETGTNNSIVCSVNNIKFINVYNIDTKINMGSY